MNVGTLFDEMPERYTVSSNSMTMITTCFSNQLYKIDDLGGSFNFFPNQSTRFGIYIYIHIQILSERGFWVDVMCLLVVLYLMCT